MYTTSSIAPVFVVHRLYHAGLLGKGSKVLLVSSESGSITLRHESEGGGNYAHHASKAALNMTGKLLSLDLKDAGVVVSIVHPGFMRTEMTKGVGFDKFWDDGGGKSVFECLQFFGGCLPLSVSFAYYDLAVTPDEAAESLVSWVEKLDISKSGEYWAPRGPREYPFSHSLFDNDRRPKLTVVRGYRNCRGDPWQGSVHAAAFALVRLRRDTCPRDDLKTLAMSRSITTEQFY